MGYFEINASGFNPLICILPLNWPPPKRPGPTPCMHGPAYSQPRPAPGVAMTTFNVNLQLIRVDPIALHVEDEEVFALAADVHGLHAQAADGHECWHVLLHAHQNWTPCT